MFTKSSKIAHSNLETGLNHITQSALFYFQPLVRHFKVDGHLFLAAPLRISSLGRQLCSRLWLWQRPSPFHHSHALHNLQAVRIFVQQKRPNFNHLCQRAFRVRSVYRAYGRLLRGPRCRVRGLQILQLHSIHQQVLRRTEH